MKTLALAFALLLAPLSLAHKGEASAQKPEVWRPEAAITCTPTGQMCLTRSPHCCSGVCEYMEAGHGLCQ